MVKTLKRKLVGSVMLITPLLSASAHADSWVLEPQASRLNFVSIKAGNTAETHSFDRIDGRIDGGEATLTIDLDSVNTAIDIRNERMREKLFNTAAHPEARIALTIDAERVAALASGETMTANVESMLNLAGVDSNVSAELDVTKVNDGTLLVSTAKPILLNAANLGLDKGVEALREIAGLPSISMAVPVSFRLLFSAE